MGASVLRLHTDGFQNEGGPAALTGYAQDEHLATTTVGLRAETRLSAELPLTVRGLLGWRRAYAADRPGAEVQPVAVAVPPSLDPRRFSLWGEGYGSWDKTSAAGNAAALDASTGGFILRAKFNQQFRLFFRYSEDKKAIVLAWVNDEDTKRAYGSKSDAYAVFRKMLEAGDPSGSWGELMKASATEENAERFKAGAGRE